MRADVVIGNPVFTDHRKVTLHKYVYIDHPDVQGPRVKNANERHRHSSATAAGLERVAASTGAGADR